MEVVQIVNSVYSSNTYVLREEGADGCWLVDVGDVEPVLEVVPEGEKVHGIFLTHTHYDHLYGVNRLVGVYPECVVYTSEAGKEGLFSEKLNFSRYHDDPMVFEGQHVQVVRDRDRIELFPNVFLTVMETPGHDTSCLTYYTEECVFSGDSFIPGLKVVTSFPRSNKGDAVCSVDKILKIAEGRGLYPGHGAKSGAL